jgi:hypothetical protein
MLFSALCDADFLDTEAFYAAAHRRDVTRGSSRTLGQLARQLDSHLAGFQADRDINRILLTTRPAAGLDRLMNGIDIYKTAMRRDRKEGLAEWYDNRIAELHEHLAHSWRHPGRSYHYHEASP